MRIVNKEKLTLVNCKFGRVLICTPNPNMWGHLITEFLIGLNFAKQINAKYYILTSGQLINSGVLSLKSQIVEIIPNSKSLDEYFLRQLNRENSRLKKYGLPPVGSRIMASKEYIRLLGHQYSYRKYIFHNHPETILMGLDYNLASLFRPNYQARHLMVENPQVYFEESVVEKLKNELSSFGITDDDKSIYLHVREAGFKKGNELQDKDGTRDDSARNASIENYLPAIKSLLEKGYKVIRSGDSSMSPLAIDGVVDLAHENVSAEMDFFALMRSEILVGCQSGPCPSLALLTNKPSLMLNAVDVIGGMPFKCDDRVVMKTIRERASGRKLKWQDLFTEDFLSNQTNIEKYEFIENSPQLIEQAIFEILNERKAPLDLPQTHFKYMVHKAARMHWALPFIAKWGTKDGFLGQGTIARCCGYSPQEDMGDIGLVDKKINIQVQGLAQADLFKFDRYSLSYFARSKVLLIIWSAEFDVLDDLKASLVEILNSGGTVIFCIDGAIGGTITRELKNLSSKNKSFIFFSLNKPVAVRPFLLKKLLLIFKTGFKKLGVISMLTSEFNEHNQNEYGPKLFSKFDKFFFEKLLTICEPDILLANLTSNNQKSKALMKAIDKFKASSFSSEFGYGFILKFHTLKATHSNHKKDELYTSIQKRIKTEEITENQLSNILFD